MSVMIVLNDEELEMVISGLACLGEEVLSNGGTQDDHFKVLQLCVNINSVAEGQKRYE